MADILQDFPIAASAHDVFRAVSTPQGLDAWWTERCRGVPALGEPYALHFGPDYTWRAEVSRCDKDRSFELRFIEADDDWNNSRVGFELEPSASSTMVRFSHRGWPEPNEHYRISTHCWALYLRLLRMNLETGLVVPYERRLLV